MSENNALDTKQDWSADECLKAPMADNYGSKPAPSLGELEERLSAEIALGDHINQAGRKVLDRAIYLRNELDDRERQLQDIRAKCDTLRRTYGLGSSAFVPVICLQKLADIIHKQKCENAELKRTIQCTAQFIHQVLDNSNNWRGSVWVGEHPIETIIKAIYVSIGYDPVKALDEKLAKPIAQEVKP